MFAWGGIVVLLGSLLLPARWYNPWVLWFLGSLSPIILIWGVAVPLFLIQDAARAFRVRRRRAHRAKGPKPAKAHPSENPHSRR
jgi:hypothetical protein